MVFVVSSSSFLTFFCIYQQPQSLETLSMYPVSSVMDVVKKLNRMHSRVFEVGFHSIFERYSSGLMPFDVALLDPPVLPENAVDSFYGVSART